MLEGREGQTGLVSTQVRLWTPEQQTPTLARWLPGTGISLNTVTVSNPRPTADRRGFLTGKATEQIKAKPDDPASTVIKLVKQQADALGVEPRRAADYVMGSSDRTAALYPTVSGFQSSVPLNASEGASRTSVVSTAQGRPESTTGEAAKLLVVKEITRMDQAAQQAQAEAVEQTKAQDSLTVPEDPYDMAELINNIVEEASSNARIKQLAGRKPAGEPLTLLSTTPGVLEDQIRGHHSMEQVPNESDRTAEIVTGVVQGESDEVERAFALLTQRVDGDGGLLVARVPKSVNGIIQARYDRAETGETVEVSNLPDETSAVLVYHRALLPIDAPPMDT